MPRPTELCRVVVNGKKFEDWTTVSVQHRYAESHHIFMVTCAERTPIPPDWTLNVFQPGDECEIYLAGILAMTGTITVRQVATSANEHGVQLIGKSKTWQVAKSSVRTKTGSFDGYTWEQIARSVCGQFGVNLKTVGKLEGTPFEYCQHEPGELAFAFIERLARMRGIIVGSDEHGNQLGIGDHTGKVANSLIEGENILRANSVISQENIYHQYFTIGQVNGNDGRRGQAASEIEAQAGGTDKLESKLVTPVEQPDQANMVRKRVEWEARWHEGTKMHVDVVVQGWIAPNGDLWRVGDDVQFVSPLHQQNVTLKIKCATFTQDDKAGTLTRLDLVLPWFLNDLIDMSGGNPTLQRPGGGRLTPTS